VTLRLPGASRTLAVSEVIVKGTPPVVVLSPPSPPSAPPASTSTITAISASMQNTFPTTSFPGHSFAAGQAIDGVLGTATSWSFALGVPGSTSPWMSVRIPAGSSVSSVEVYPRQDALQERLATFQIWVGTHAGEISTAAPGSLALCGSMTAAATSGPFTVTCASALAGSVVTLRLPGASRTLAVSEVIVKGTSGTSNTGPTQCDASYGSGSTSARTCGASFPVCQGYTPGVQFGTCVLGTSGR